MQRSAAVELMKIEKPLSLFLAESPKLLLGAVRFGLDPDRDGERDCPPFRRGVNSAHSGG